MLATPAQSRLLLASRRRILQSVKILALEVEVPGLSPAEFAPHLQDEARTLWDLYQAGVVREAYFRPDRHTAVLVLECENIRHAEVALAALPLVQRRLITFELVPLEPYSGYSRLFVSNDAR
jgi:hypothetical protein